jgi:esterase
MHVDRTIRLRGLRFHYTEWGDPTAPPLIMLHGITGHARTWDAEAAALSRRYRVFALDQRGHGDSDGAPGADYQIATMAADLTDFVEALDLARVTLVALSMGGRVSIAYAGMYPPRVERLVLVDIGPDINPTGRVRIGTMMARSPESFATESEAFEFAHAANPRTDLSHLRHRIHHALKRLPGGGFAWKYDRAIRDAMRQGGWHDPIDLWALLAAIRCPTLIVRGVESDVLSPEVAKRMVEVMADARLVEVPNAGHTVPGDQPAAFLALITDFLQA